MSLSSAGLSDKSLGKGHLVESNSEKTWGMNFDAVLITPAINKVVA